MTATTSRRPGGVLPPVVLPAGVSTRAGRDAVAAMRTVFRERNRSTARLLEAMHVAGRVCADGSRRDALDRFSADEVCAALGWSPTMAGRWLELAGDLVSRLPMVLAAMREGSLDDTKARALSEWTRDLSVDHAVTVCTQVLEHAPATTVGALIERVGELAIALDPEWAARREARARRRARVVGAVSPEGTASLSGYDLPLDEATEALARVEAVADRVRGGGVDIPVARLRATVYLRLLDGFGAGLDDDALVRALIVALRDPGRPGPGRPGPGQSQRGPGRPRPGRARRPG